jgi:DNA-binding NarL/FixJ family response regulator
MMTTFPPPLYPQKILVVDDHESVLKGTVQTLQQAYPDAAITSVQVPEAVLNEMQRLQPDLVVLDLSMPEAAGAKARQETGIKLLSTLMQEYPTLNIVVQSSHVKALVLLKPTIDLHEGGFVAVDKAMPTQDFLKRVDWAWQGLVHTKDMRSGLELRPEWLEVLQLACVECLQDRAIAKRMHIAEKSVQNYWAKIRDVLEVYPEEDKNLRMQTAKRAREEYLIEE